MIHDVDYLFKTIGANFWTRQRSDRERGNFDVIVRGNDLCIRGPCRGTSRTGRDRKKTKE